jgi:hypothetical protein
MFPIRIVLPSGADLTTSVEPMTPPAPDLLSTTQDWPQASVRWAASRRAAMSVVPPGAAGQTMRTFWVGFHAAWACRPRGSSAAAGRAAAVPKAARRVRLRIIIPPFDSCLLPTT